MPAITFDKSHETILGARMHSCTSPALLLTPHWFLEKPIGNADSLLLRSCTLFFGNADAGKDLKLLDVDQIGERFGSAGKA
jgi:hypothetical protein